MNRRHLADILHHLMRRFSKAVQPETSVTK
jgi:hypothetical protein